ncbi:MAG TPA: hypothetical protein VJC03_02445, partial [bacterium]|nr:hypothetical protein [bacterium]
MIRRIFFIPVLFFAVFLSATETIKMQSDWLEYDYKDEKAEAGDRVKISIQGVEAEGNRLYLDQKNRTVVLDENVSMTDGTTTVRGAHFEMIGSTRVVIRDGLVETPPYFIKADEIVRESEKKYILKKSIITTCELAHPHYGLKAGKFFYYPGDRLVGKNVWFTLWNMPVLPIPYWWQSLRDRPWGFGIDIGYSRYQGSFVRTKFYYKWSPVLKTHILYDYFSKIGTGAGFRVEYKKDTARADIEYYRIKDSEKFNLSWWQNVNNFIIQADNEVYSSPSFNFDYFWEQDVLYPVRVTNRIGVSRNQKRYNFLAYFFQEEESVNQQPFRRIEVVNPGLDLTLLPRKFLFLNYQLRVQGRQQYLQSWNEYRFLRSEQLNFFRSFRIFRFLSFSPSITWENAYTEAGKNTDFFLSNENIHFQFSRYWGFDLSQNYRREIRGQETINTISFANTMKLSKRMTLINNMDWNILDGFGDYTEKISPLSSRLTWRGSPYIYFTHRYQTTPTSALKAARIMGSELSVQYKILSTQIYYDRALSKKDYLDLQNRLDFKIGRKWKLGLQGRYDLGYRTFSARNLNSKDLEIYRD